MPCKPKGLNSCGKANFSLYFKDKHSNAAVKDAVLTLQSNCCPLFSLKSSADGSVKLPPICPGTYTMSVARAPAGYELCAKLPTLRVTLKGNLRIDGKTLRRLTIFFERIEK